MTFDLTIAICTYKRERLLARALQSLIAAQPATGLSFEVVVVDNSEDGCAREVIARLSAQARAAPHPFSIRAIDAQPANISVARNAAVGATRSTWLAFVDDDQQFAEDWLIQGLAGDRRRFVRCLVRRCRARVRGAATHDAAHARAVHTFALDATGQRANRARPRQDAGDRAGDRQCLVQTRHDAAGPIVRSRVRRGRRGGL